MERFNPWWSGEPDPAYESWLQASVRWTPRQAAELSLEPSALNFLSGPRQVGKTTLVKVLIHELRRGHDPRSIFYYSCDELYDFKELGEVLDSYLSARSAWGIAGSYIFLDEITFVEEWWRALKARIDGGALRSDAVTVTGSASLDLMKQKEYFPGRRGTGRDVVVRPLSFGEYCGALSKLDLMGSATIEGVAKAVGANAIHAESLSRMFGDYLQTGGFPLPLREKADRGRVTEVPRRALLDGLRADWGRVGRNDRYMKEVLAYIFAARGTPISWNGIAKNTSIGSPNTSRSYVETLQDLLAVEILELIQPDGRVIHRKNRKVHFVDPLLYKVLADYSGQPADEAALVEGVVASHLARTFQTYYWKNGGEVDAVVVEGKEQVGIETKWGYKEARRPRHLRTFFALDRTSIRVFLASLRIPF